MVMCLRGSEEVVSLGSAHGLISRRRRGLARGTIGPRGREILVMKLRDLSDGARRRAASPRRGAYHAAGRLLRSSQVRLLPVEAFELADILETFRPEQRLGAGWYQVLAEWKDFGKEQ